MAATIVPARNQPGETRPPRVLSLSSVFPRPGEERLGLFVRSRLIALSRRLPLEVLCPVPYLDYSSGRLEFPSVDGRQIDHGGLTVHYVRWFYPPLYGALNGWLMSACVARQAGRLRSRFPFEVIDAHFGHPDGVAGHRLARRFGCPYVITLRGNETLHAEDPAKRRRMGEALRGAAAVIGVSRPLRDFAVSLGVRPERAHVIPNGVDSTVFHPRARQPLRERFGMDPEAQHVVSAGYLIERKGHHRAVEALARAHAAGIRAHLWIVGGRGREGDATDLILRAVEAAGLTSFVHLTGSVPPETLAAYMAASDLLCLATSREGWPNVVNEALACGTPVLAADVGGVPDMLPEERYGIVVPPNDAEALAAGLIHCLERQWDRDAIAGWGAARSWENVAAELAGLFCQVSRDAARAAC